MPFRVNLLVLLWPLAVPISMSVGLAGCSGCGDDETAVVAPSPTDAGDGDGDDDHEPVFEGGRPLPMRPDAAPIPAGDPPEELEDETCAADSNKVYELVTSNLQAHPAELAVDQVEATFGMAFVTTEDAECNGAVRFASLTGPAGLNEPVVSEAYDGCTIVDRAALTRTDSDWLLAVIDNRDGRELWVHSFDPEESELSSGHRLTENMGFESAMAMVSLGDRALIAWAETGFSSEMSAIKLRFLSADGEPEGDEITLEEESERYYEGFSLTRLSEQYVAFAYRRSQGLVDADLVMDVLDAETGERDRDTWVITTEGGTTGTIDVAADASGAGVAYSFAQGTARQVWFQQLTTTGRPALVMVGLDNGGPAPPIPIVANPNLGADVSLAKLPAGYALAYRALPGGNVSEAQVRVAFLDRVGAMQGSGSAIALASESGGQTAIAAAYDGRVALTWTDSHEDGTSTVRALILPCVGSR